MNITRRSFMRSVSAAGVALGSASSALAQQQGVKTSRPSGRIDVHCHFLPDFYSAALSAAGHEKPDGMPGIPAWSESGMLKAMDSLGIERAYISISSPGVHFGDDSAARDLARRVNIEGARLKRAYPDRIGFYASTPLPDVKGAIEEIQFAYKELNPDGVVFMTNFNGVYLGDKELEPVYEALEAHNAVLFIHPTTPGSKCSCGAGHEDLRYPRPMLEFLFDTTRSVTNMVLSGALERHAKLRVLVPHAGAALPILSSRIETMAAFTGAPGGPPIPSMSKALKKMHFDLAGSPVPLQLNALLAVCDSENLHYGSDMPFTPPMACGKLIEALEKPGVLSEEMLNNIMRHNSEKLFSL